MCFLSFNLSKNQRLTELVLNHAVLIIVLVGVSIKVMDFVILHECSDFKTSDAKIQPTSCCFSRGRCLQKWVACNIRKRPQEGGGGSNWGQSRLTEVL